MAESLHINRAEGVVFIVAIDSTARGPALGGCRWKPYPDDAAARRDALNLASAMTRKSAMARLALGGGKAVVIGDPATRTREQLLAFGDFVDSLDGRYITAADMGTSAAEMRVIGERTRHVSGRPETEGGAGDPGPYTAAGVFLGMVEAARHAGFDLAGARVAVQGVGSVGRALIQRLLEAGAHVLAADPVPERLDTLPAEVECLAPLEIVEAECDVLAPCGPPEVVRRENLEALRCRVICGAANNPLADLETAKALSERDIVYAPDFVVNAGGLIHLAVALEGGDPVESMAKLGVIPENLARVFEHAKATGVDPGRAAVSLAQDAIAAA